MKRIAMPKEDYEENSNAEDDYEENSNAKGRL